MQNIQVHRYQRVDMQLPEGAVQVADEWQGWIEPDNHEWIMFVATDGKPVVFLNRDPETGAVL